MGRWGFRFNFRISASPPGRCLNSLPPSSHPPPMKSPGQCMGNRNLCTATRPALAPRKLRNTRRNHPASPSPRDNPMNNPAIPDQIIPPLLPDNYILEDRRLILGFPVTIDWMCDYPEQHQDLVPDFDPTSSFVTRVVQTQELLRVVSGMQDHNLKLELVFRPGVITDPAHIPDEQYREDMYMFVFAVCNSTSESFYDRPSKAQMAVLQRELGKGEPEWYLDVKHASYYLDDYELTRTVHDIHPVHLR
ncbi:hypothetical protein DXG01_000800 [Tephrocybe rancida]|nr:hypothetical protein DXG01_000800 [Tephrocybe rancida]